MNKSLVLASLVAAVALAACGKKEEAPAAGRHAGSRDRAAAAAPPLAVASAADARPRRPVTPHRRATSATEAKDAAAKPVEAAASAVKN